MKRFSIILALALCVLGSFSASAGGFKYGDGFKIGAVGIADYSSMRYQGYRPSAYLTGGAGLAAQFNLDCGISVQPEILYNRKRAAMASFLAGTQLEKINNMVGYLEVPVMVSIGVDMGHHRPFAFLQPYFGYGIDCESVLATTTSRMERHNKWDSQNLNRAEYGIGLGAGVDLRHLQFRIQYSKNFNPLCQQPNSVGGADPIYLINSYTLKNTSYGSLQLVMGLFF